MNIIFSYIIRFEHYRDSRFGWSVLYKEWLGSSTLYSTLFGFFFWANLTAVIFSFTAVISVNDIHVFTAVTFTFYGCNFNIFYSRNFNVFTAVI